MTPLLIKRAKQGGREKEREKKKDLEKDMVQGTLEVLLVAAKGLDNTDFLGTFVLIHHAISVLVVVVVILYV